MPGLASHQAVVADLPLSPQGPASGLVGVHGFDDAEADNFEEDFSAQFSVCTQLVSQQFTSRNPTAVLRSRRRQLCKRTSASLSVTGPLTLRTPWLGREECSSAYAAGPLEPRTRRRSAMLAPGKPTEEGSTRSPVSAGDSTHGVTGTIGYMPAPPPASRHKSRPLRRHCHQPRREKPTQTLEVRTAAAVHRCQQMRLLMLTLCARCFCLQPPHLAWDDLSVGTLCFDVAACGLRTSYTQSPLRIAKEEAELPSSL